MFDFSNYPVNSKYYDPKNYALLGKMRDKFKGKTISEFVGLKSKMCSLISVDDGGVDKAIGLNKNMKHKEFVDFLFNKKVIRYNMKRIQSKLHGLGIYNVYKISLCYFDDKRHLLDDSVNNLAYFHKDIRD